MLNTNKDRTVTYQPGTRVHDTRTQRTGTIAPGATGLLRTVVFDANGIDTVHVDYLATKPPVPADTPARLDALYERLTHLEDRVTETHRHTQHQVQALTRAIRNMTGHAA